MADRPIIFSAPMVQALLEGRKTQTRRLYKPRQARDPWHLPYAIGDRLWVRESVRAAESYDGEQRGVHYLADDTWRWLPDTPEAEAQHFLLRRYRATDPDLDAYKSVPSIHMPRWVSRLTLVVTEVRLQRLPEITQADAIAEGAPAGWEGGGKSRDWFFALWDQLHGAEAAAGAPLVVALTFTVERAADYT